MFLGGVHASETWIARDSSGQVISVDSSGDPTRFPSVYRDPNEPKQWEPKDPLDRFAKFLETKRLWSEEWEKKQREEIDAEITKIHDEVSKLGPPDIDSMFEDVYEVMPQHLEEQRQWLHTQARTTSPHYHH